MTGRPFSREQLYRYRREAGFTQAELASMVRVSTATVARWERGEFEPDAPIMPRLARILGVAIDDLRMPSDGAGDGAVDN